MSFKNDYKNKMDGIRTDGYIRQKILNRLAVEEEKANKKRKAPFIKAAVAFACLLLAVAVAIPSVSILSSNYFSPSKESSHKEESDTEIAGDYSQIYEKVKEIRKLNASVYLQDDAVDMEIIEEYSTGTASSTNATGAPTNDSAQGTSKNTESDSERDYSETNNQVDGVDEADIIKTDGKYIYALSAVNKKIRIIKAGKIPEVISEITLKNENYYSHNMYLYENYLVVFSTVYDLGVYASECVSVVIYDITDPAAPVIANEIKQDGGYNNSRLIGDKLYLISEYYVNSGKISADDPATYVPEIYCKDTNGAVPASCIYIGEVCNQLCYTVICGYDITDGSLCSTQSILGGTYALYCSTENIITAGYSQNNETEITRFSISEGKIELKAQGILKGGLLNQFSIDEYNGYFRFVTTDSTVKETRTDKVVSATIETSNALYVFDGDLKQVGAIENLAPDERVYSVRFMGDKAYFVTFRQVDPLFTADLSDPENPVIIGSLKIPGFSSYLHPYGDGLLLGIGQDADEETGRKGNVKLSMFNISDPANVTEESKKILEMSYSEALDNHKAVLIDTKLNIVGFCGYYANGAKYSVYAYENGGFVQKLSVPIDLKYTARGLYIGDELYIITDSKLMVYSLENYEKITDIYL